MSHNAHRLYQERFTAKKVYGEMVAYLEEVAHVHGKRAEINSTSAGRA